MLIQKTDTIFTAADQTKVSAEVGIIEVPENRSQPQSRQIKVHFVRLKSLSDTPGTPLFYVEGGGTPCTQQAGNPQQLAAWIPYLKISDVILVDQRGTRDKELLWIWDGEFPKDFFITEISANDHWRAMCSRALPVFDKKGIDVSGYTTIEMARDFESIRRVLKIEKYSILGFSFGTQVGLTIMKMYHDKIENAVLVGVDGLNHSFNLPSYLDKQLERISQLVESDERVNVDIPDLTVLLKRVMKKLEVKPVSVSLRNPINGNTMQVDIGPFGLALILRLDIDDATDIPILPRLLFDLDRDNTEILQWFTQKRVAFALAIPGNGLSQGIAFGASPDRWKKIEQEASLSIFKNAVNFPFYGVISTWRKIPMDIDVTEQMKRNVRTLFISGDLDCRTPPDQVEEIRQGFTDAVHLVVANAGHEQILPHPEIKIAILSFLTGANVSSAKASYPPIKFIPVKEKDTASHPAIR